MVSDAELNRVSHSYRRGYRDGQFGRPLQDALPPEHAFDRPFAAADYRAGHEAGRNDAYWANVFSGRHAWRNMLAWVAGDEPLPVGA